MNRRYLGKIQLSQALAEQERVFQLIRLAPTEGQLLGFECEPVVSLGVRASFDRDLILPHFPLLPTDRGGQATIHNPGQLVIFPICPVRAIGARAWVEGLGEITRRCLALWAIDSRWDKDAPGLYTARGKIMACGVRLRQGVSTHGLALNVDNNLADFAQIRSCGVEGAAMDKMGPGIELTDVFTQWCKIFYDHFALNPAAHSAQLTR